jgi:hypothetical protein
MIGAHAAVRDAPLLTRDTARHRTAFPQAPPHRPLSLAPRPPARYRPTHGLQQASAPPRHPRPFRGGVPPPPPRHQHRPPHLRPLRLRGMATPIFEDARVFLRGLGEPPTW